MNSLKMKNLKKYFYLQKILSEIVRFYCIICFERTLRQNSKYHPDLKHGYGKTFTLKLPFFRANFSGLVFKKCCHFLKMLHNSPLYKTRKFHRVTFVRLRPTCQKIILNFILISWHVARKRPNHAWTLFLRFYSKIPFLNF